MTTLKSQYEQQIAELELKNDDESKLQVRRLKTKITSLLATSGEENRSLLATFELKENISKEELEKGKKINIEELRKLIEEKERLKEMVEKFKFEDAAAELVEVEKKISELESKLNYKEVKSYSCWESGLLVQKFKWDSDNQIIEFDDGVRYSEAEILEIYERKIKGEELKKLHQFKKMFPGRFMKDGYSEQNEVKINEGIYL